MVGGVLFFGTSVSSSPGKSSKSRSGARGTTTGAGRLNFIQQGRHLLIDDTYNANPTSMRAAAEVLAQQEGGSSDGDG
jgi:UDP-N-acetylmuramyl pentapeptide synthase